MTEIQTASLPHALAGRDVVVGAKKRSGKTLAFVVPVLEKLFRERYTPGRGVGSIILCPTRELACQTFEVFKSVARHHSFSIGLLTGGGNSVDLEEKDHGNDINILVCTPSGFGP
ncbi:DEAD-box ATP-dependent RNA helicase 32 [Morus notabilis]|uniref:DEAD-box ATP-dependent RNA helicase 32 n=1 Tax=Morus notabilis TaxID=981085 RepID=UPI000CED4774|nr:DEAD-box ATP-dependent RNA helicase 32 [Morus notabilis]